MMQVDGICEFVVYGKPGQYQRQRHTKAGFNYQPTAYREAKNIIKDSARVAMGDRAPWTGPIKLTFSAYYPRPLGKNKVTIMNDAYLMEKAPDKDNIEKAILDGCEGIVYPNDAQVCMWGPGAKWIVAGPSNKAGEQTAEDQRPRTVIVFERVEQ